MFNDIFVKYVNIIQYLICRQRVIIKQFKLLLKIIFKKKIQQIIVIEGLCIKIINKVSIILCKLWG